MSDTDRIEHLCEVMHDAYEKAAIGAGWETQQASRKPWADVPEANRVVMLVAVAALLAEVSRWRRTDGRMSRACRCGALVGSSARAGGRCSVGRVSCSPAPGVGRRGGAWRAGGDRDRPAQHDRPAPRPHPVGERARPL